MTVQEATEEQLREFLLKLFVANSQQPINESGVHMARAISDELINREEVEP